MVDERSVESVWVVSHELERRLNLVLDLVVVGHIVDADLTLFDQRELQRCIEVVNQLSCSAFWLSQEIVKAYLLTGTWLDSEVRGNVATENTSFQCLDVTSDIGL
jgi:hypothetical protein